MFNNSPLWPVPASTGAGNVDALYIFLVLISSLMCAAIFTIILIFAMRYRRRAGVQAEQIEGSTALEITWSVVPLGIFMVIFAWGAVIYFQERTPPRGASEVYVVAKQWMWKLEHQEGQREINELHVPVGRDVKRIMTSQDVRRSFYVPAFRIKQDVLPGRYTTAWFRATKPGVYHLFCSQYCGTMHSGMIGQVVVMEPAQYEAWLSGGTSGSLAAGGERSRSSAGEPGFVLRRFHDYYLSDHAGVHGAAILRTEQMVHARLGGAEPRGCVTPWQDILHDAEGRNVEAVYHVLRGHNQFDVAADRHMQFVDLALTLLMFELPHPLFGYDINFGRAAR